MGSSLGEVKRSEALCSRECSDHPDQVIPHRGDDDQHSTSIGFAELGNAFFSAPRLKLEVDRVVENYLLSLRRSDSMLSDVVGVALIPLEHMLLPPNSRVPRRRLLNELF
jgi:hypothetical protein